MGESWKTLTDIMSPAVVQVAAAAPVLEALGVMRGKRISSVLVTEGDEPDGILTERDVVRALHQRASLDGLTCRDLRHAPLISLEQTVSHLEAYHLMTSRNIRHLAVHDDQGLIVGIVTEADLLRSLDVEYFTNFKDVGGVMGPDVCTLPADASVAEAIAIMDAERASCVVVVDQDGQPDGVITERDIVRLSADGRPQLGMSLREAASRPVRTVAVGTLLHEAVATMVGARIRRLVVVDAAGRVCGLLSQHEVIQGLENRYVGYLKDVIRRQAEEIRDQGARLDQQILLDERILLDNVLCSATDTAVIVADRDGIAMFGTPQCEAILGAAPESIHGQTLWSLLPRLGIEVTSHCREMLELNGEVEFEAIRDGAVPIDVRLRQLLGPDGTPRGTILMARDGRDRQDAREKLLAEKDLSDAVIDAAPGLFYLVDAQHRLLRWNRAWDALMPESSARGGDLLERFGGRVSPFAAAVHGAFACGEAEIELPLTTPSGGIRHFVHKLRRTVIGRTNYLVGSATDITERKASEDNLRRLVEHLHAGNAELERFAEIAAHDLQEPLRAITNHTQLLARRLKGRLDAETEEIFGFLVTAAKRMRELVLDLNDYSHINRRAERFCRIDLAEALNAAIASLARPIEESGAVLEIGALPQVWGDSGDMARVFRNLIGNSIKFRRPDTQPRIVVDAAATPEGWQVSVRDNGIGFDPDYAEQVFVIFKRLHPAHVYPGTGIGLTICKSIIERHSGRIWCEPQPGGGTDVHFVLPAASDAEGRELD